MAEASGRSKPRRLCGLNSLDPWFSNLPVQKVHPPDLKPGRNLKPGGVGQVWTEHALRPHEEAMFSDALLSALNSLHLVWVSALGGKGRGLCHPQLQHGETGHWE